MEPISLRHDSAGTCVPFLALHPIRTSANRWYSSAGPGMMCVIKAAKALVLYALLANQRRVPTREAPAYLYTRKNCDRPVASLRHETSKEQEDRRS